MKELKNDIKNKQFKSCYLFYGSEGYLKKAYENSIKKAIVDESFETMNFDMFDDKKVLTTKVIDALETLPFMAEKRFVLVRDSGLFQTGRKDESEKMADYLSTIPESACLLFVEEEIDKRGRLYKSIVKNGRAVEFKTPDEKTLVNWIMSELKKKKMEINSATAIYLIRTTGSNMENIVGEIEKLSAYKAQNGKIENEDIDKVCIKSFETKIFDLVAAIGNKKPETALEIYRNMLLMKESPIMILAMIIRQFRLIFQCKLLLKQGEASASIAQRLSQREFVIRECVKQSQNFSIEILEKAVKECLETDIAIKTGGMTGELAVELLILSYSKKL